MNIQAFVEKLQELPEEKQIEVADFVDYLFSRFARQSQRYVQWSESDFSSLSMTQAMRGMENEPALYGPADIKERWS